MLFARRLRGRCSQNGALDGEGRRRVVPTRIAKAARLAPTRGGSSRMGRVVPTRFAKASRLAPTRGAELNLKPGRSVGDKIPSYKGWQQPEINEI